MISFSSRPRNSGKEKFNSEFCNSFSDRCRTTSNMLGDAYGAAVVEALSKKDLDAMDEEREQERKAQEDEDLESAHAMLDKKWKAVKKVTQL